MMDSLQDAVKGYWSYKISAVFILVLLFMATVTFMDSRIDSNSDAAIDNVGLSANLSATYAFQEYYNDTNQSQRSQKVEEIRADILNQSHPIERGLYYKTALVTGFAVKQIDPFYPIPCLETTEDCTFYLDQEIREEIDSKLASIGKEENLEAFADRYNLTVEEQFYANYSTNSTGQSSFQTENSRGQALDTATYLKNTAYLALLGLLLTTFAAFTREVIKGDET